MACGGSAGKCEFVIRPKVKVFSCCVPLLFSGPPGFVVFQLRDHGAASVLRATCASCEVTVLKILSKRGVNDLPLDNCLDNCVISNK